MTPLGLLLPSLAFLSLPLLRVPSYLFSSDFGPLLFNGSPADVQLHGFTNCLYAHDPQICASSPLPLLKEKVRV